MNPEHSVPESGPTDDPAGAQGATRKIRGASSADTPGPAEPADPMRLPFEHDQSSDSSSQQPNEIMRQAKRDIDAGLVDTELRGTPGLGAERRDELLDREKARSSGSSSKQQP